MEKKHSIPENHPEIKNTRSLMKYDDEADLSRGKRRKTNEKGDYASQPSTFLIWTNPRDFAEKWEQFIECVYDSLLPQGICIIEENFSKAFSCDPVELSKNLPLDFLLLDFSTDVKETVDQAPIGDASTNSQASTHRRCVRWTIGRVKNVLSWPWHLSCYFHWCTRAGGPTRFAFTPPHNVFRQADCLGTEDGENMSKESMFNYYLHTFDTILSKPQLPEKLYELLLHYARFLRNQTGTQRYSRFCFVARQSYLESIEYVVWTRVGYYAHSHSVYSLTEMDRQLHDSEEPMIAHHQSMQRTYAQRPSSFPQRSSSSDSASSLYGPFRTLLCSVEPDFTNNPYNHLTHPWNTVLFDFNNLQSLNDVSPSDVILQKVGHTGTHSTIVCPKQILFDHTTSFVLFNEKYVKLHTLGFPGIVVRARSWNTILDIDKRLRRVRLIRLAYSFCLQRPSQNTGGTMRPEQHTEEYEDHEQEDKKTRDSRGFISSQKVSPLSPENVSIWYGKKNEGVRPLSSSSLSSSHMAILKGSTTTTCKPNRFRVLLIYGSTV
jgi:hypothetical protein